MTRLCLAPYLPDDWLMAEKRSIYERIMNRLFALPAVAQLWAKRAARGTSTLVDLSGDIPFARLRKPLAQCTVALITTGGIHLPEQTPFDMENPDGDASYRELPGNVDMQRIAITHKYYDHTDADTDLNVIFPLTHFRDLVSRGVIGALAPRHFGFMGHIEGAQLPILNGRTAQEVATKLRADRVDIAFLTPA